MTSDLIILIVALVVFVVSCWLYRKFARRRTSAYFDSDDYGDFDGGGGDAGT